jgi:hypothetical protein
LEIPSNRRAIGVQSATHPIAGKTRSPTRGEIPIAAPRAEGYRQRGVGSIRIDPVDVRIAFIDDAPDARILNCLAP